MTRSAMRRRPAIPPITPPITAVLWLLEDDEVDVDVEVGDCAAVVGFVGDVVKTLEVVCSC